MSDMILRSTINSPATHEPFIEAFGNGTLFTGLSHSLKEMQSPSVTPSGTLWLQALARLTYAPSHVISQRELQSKELPQNETRSQREHDLIQLLRAWREGDEQEQRSTWKHLKRALVVSPICY